MYLKVPLKESFFFFTLTKNIYLKSLLVVIIEKPITNHLETCTTTTTANINNTLNNSPLDALTQSLRCEETPTRISPVMMTSSSNENNSSNASSNTTENNTYLPLSPQAVYSASNPGGQRIVWVQLPDTPRWPGRVVTNIEAGKPALIERDKVSYFPGIYFKFFYL